ncbi:MAG: hypothetical protein SGI84_06930 [Gemmatimonadota bacterium]|nr:hypothetical protein [Gemmatimonadota bacterium]
MSKVLSAMTLLALVACAPKEEAAPTVVDAPEMAAPVAGDPATAAPGDSTMARDTAKAP